MVANQKALSVFRMLLTVAGLVGFAAADAAAQATQHLIAAPFYKSVVLPNGTSVTVPMWGYAPADEFGVAVGPVSSPGPQIAVPVGQSLQIVLHNRLPVATSLVIPGQVFAGTPVVQSGRVVAMTSEAAPGGTATYTFNDFKPGTFLYQSGSHQAVQIQMGLYGAVKQDATAGSAYTGVPYTNEVVLVYSEVDVALHQAVCPSIVSGDCTAGTYGTPGGPTSTFDYNPTLFLINGQSYANDSATPPILAGAAGQNTLVRFLNAGLRTHVPVVDSAVLALVAEDGNRYPYSRPQAAVLLPAGKTLDAIWMPTAARLYSVYDRSLSLSAPGSGAAGMLVKLRISGAPSPVGSPVAVDDVFATPEDTATAPGSSVATNDGGATSYALVTSTAVGSLSFTPAGGFTYSPAPNFFGVDSFTYRAINASGSSFATAIINVLAMPDQPVAAAQGVGVQVDESLPVALSGSDADGDALTFYLTSLPAQGAVSIVDPLTSVLTPLVAANLWGGATPKAIPSGNLVYSAGATAGAPSFNFIATTSALILPNSDPATVGIAVHVAPDLDDASLTQTLSLNVVGPNGAAIGAFRWTLEEDRTYDVRPGLLDPDTLSVSFHASYMPVKLAGDETTLGDLKVDPSKRYFVSVLPTNGSYTNGGAQVAAGQGSVTVRVNEGPFPTAQILVRVFNDNAALNGMWDTDEAGLNGFAVTIEDAGGRYGMSAAQQLMDAFGNQIGTVYAPCPSEEPCYPAVLSYGNGFVLTADNAAGEPGWALIKNLAPGKYGVKVMVPGGTSWIQTATIEGTRTIDAWVKSNEPPYFSEFGPPGPHAEIGFVIPVNTIADVPGNGSYTISGQVTNLHHSRPPNFQMFSGAPFDFTQPWVALNTGAEGGELVYAQPTDADGNFSISGVPQGSYQLVIFDSALNIIMANQVLDVSGNMNLDEVPVQQWYSRLYHYVFEDTNQNGFRDAGEPGMQEQAINLRFRDGSMYQSMPTDRTGFVPFEQTFPFFSWLIAEVDFTRFRATGATVVVDAGGNPTNATWAGAVGAEVDPAVLVPQTQAAAEACPSPGSAAICRTETGPVLLEGFQGFIGQSSVMLWGKAPYAPVGTPDVNVFPFDDFPGACAVGQTAGVTCNRDVDGNGAFDGDEFNGGISGIVHYSITRAENDPRWGGAEVWEPGIPGVTVQLWSADRTRLLNEVTTDSWDESQPTGCRGTSFTFLGQAKDCYDGLRNFNQVRPAVFDGGYAFMSQIEPVSGTAGWSTPVEDRMAGFREVPLPAGKYVVRVVPPRGYKIVKEEDKNVDFGEEYIPQEFYLDGYPIGDAGLTAAPPKAGTNEEPLAVPFCVGSLHEVATELALYPGILGAYGGDQRPLCDQKLVTLRAGQNPGANFFLFTEAPIAGHIVGFVLDDTTNEFDPNSPQFGEKYAPPFMPVSIRDWKGAEIASTFTDAYGRYNVLVPSTFTANQPIPSGMSPSILQACINPPTTVTAAGLTVPNPHHYKQYSHFCYTVNFMPGTTSYLDTPVLPTGAYTGVGQFPVDAELPSGTPMIAKVTNAADVNGTTVATTGILSDASPLRIGPYIVDQGAGVPGTRTIDITPAGMMAVPNPAYDGLGGLQPKTVVRDYTFGSDVNRIVVKLGAATIPAGSVTLTGGVLRVVIPQGSVTDQLSVERCLSISTSPCTDWRKSVVGVTLTVATPAMHSATPPIVKLATQTIQQAIDAAPVGALVLVRPGNYDESVIVKKPVRLQGWGALATVINAVNAPTEKLQTWRNDVAALLNSRLDAAGGSAYLTELQDLIVEAPFNDPLAVTTALGGEAPGVMVLGPETPAGEALACASPLVSHAYCMQSEGLVMRPNARIDGFSIIGAMNAPGIMVNAYARYLGVGNNRITNNSGDFAGGIQVGQPGLPVPPLELDGTRVDENALNTSVTIHNNLVGQNAGLEIEGGAGVVIGTGADLYKVVDNFIAGNFTGGRGAGVSHIGWSNGGTIDRNSIVFNEGFNQGTGRSGGGVFIGGREALPDERTPGSGTVWITNNQIQGNFAASGDGGGVALDGVNGDDAANPSHVYFFNNMIVNNAAGLAGGGVSLHDASFVEIIHNTIARNDSLATAGGAFTNNPNQSNPQPAGIAARANSYGNDLYGSNDVDSFSRPTTIQNSIVWQNRTFRFGLVAAGVQNPGDPDPTPDRYGLVNSPAGSGGLNGLGGRTPCVIGTATFRCWDFGVPGSNGATFAPESSVVTETLTVNGPNNTETPPLFVSSYVNGSRNPTIVIPEAGSILTPVAFDEGGTFIRPIFGPLSLQNPAGLALFGNYHLTAGLSGQNVPVSFANGRTPLLFDIDAQPRPTSGSNLSAPHRGADEKTSDPAPGSGTGIGPAITAQPANQTIAINTAATLTVTATGTAPLTYQWYEGVSPSGTLIPGATSASHVTAPLTEVSYFWVSVTNAYGVATSVTATINVAVAPAIATHPAGQTIWTGQTATLSVVATGSAPLSYQWYQGTSPTTTTPAPGVSNLSSYTTPALTAATSYWVRVANAVGVADSNTATITVQADLSVTKTDGVTSRNQGQSTTYTIVVTNNGPTTVTGAVVTDTRPANMPSWSWSCSPNPACNGTGTSTAATINRTLASLAGGGSVTFTTTGNVGATATGNLVNTANVAVPAGRVDPTPGNNSATDTDAINAPPVITVQPASQTIVTGTTATLTVTATGTAPLTYQWYQGTSPSTTTLAPGVSNGSSYTTPLLTTTTSYWVRVSNTAGAVNSNTATVTVVLLYFSTGDNFNPPGLGGTADDADIISWNGATSFSRVIDASAAPYNLGTADVDGFVRVSATQFYVSFNDASVNLGGGLTVQDEDIVFWNGSAWSVFFDGTVATSGLDSSGGTDEDVDAFAILPGGILVVSTAGTNNVPGAGANTNRDLLSCVMSGATCTAAGWSVYFDGDDVGLTAGSENIDGVQVRPEGIYLSTVGEFTTSGTAPAVTSGAGVAGTVFLCGGPTTGAASACSSVSIYFPGFTGGNAGQGIDAFFIP